jgi:hypothetical protein
MTIFPIEVKPCFLRSAVMVMVSHGPLPFYEMPRR